MVERSSPSRRTLDTSHYAAGRKECYNQALAALSGRGRAPPRSPTAAPPVEALTTGVHQRREFDASSVLRDRTPASGLTGRAVRQQRPLLMAAADG